MNDLARALAADLRESPAERLENLQRLRRLTDAQIAAGRALVALIDLTISTHERNHHE